jgi:NAD(P)-dependent dehydrogenase (short-subunit alcohol dehydrogenase family)
LVFNNAGINAGNRRPLTEIVEENFERTIAVNLKGP